jgi:predicted Fe-S protein YdhL (DUF1289 family)
MKFIPCQDNCTNTGTHCNGCGRAHEEIAATKALVKNMVDFVRAQHYENPEEFMAAVSKSVVKKSALPPV